MCACYLLLAAVWKKGHCYFLEWRLSPILIPHPPSAARLTLSTTQTASEWKKVDTSKGKKHEIVIEKYPKLLCHTEMVISDLGNANFRHLPARICQNCLRFLRENVCFANFTVVKVESRYIFAPSFSSLPLFVALCCCCTRLSHPLCVTRAHERQVLTTFSHETFTKFVFF